MLAKNGWLCRLSSCLFALAAVWPASVASAETCCLPDGSCVVITVNSCTFLRGSPNPQQTACGPDDCVPTPCCDRTGQCAVQTRVSCAQPSTIAAGSSCSPASCVSMGVCCIGASCTLTAPGACTGGTFNAGLSACDPSPCPLPAVCADPQFAPGPTYSLNSVRTVATSFVFVRSIRAADFDRDGVPDLAVLALESSPTAPAFAVALRDAGGGVRELRRTALPFEAFSMAVGDLNNDSYPDVAVFGVAASSDYRLVVLLNRGAAAPGEFTVLPSVATGGGQGVADSRTILVSDVTGDGNADVVLTNSRVQIFAGDGTGGLAAPFQLDGANFYLGAVSADFNSDGKPDLVIFPQAGGGFSQYLAPVSSSSTPVASITGYRTSSFAAADLTGDSRPDLVLGGLTPGLSLAVFPAQASGVLDTSAPIVSPLGTNPLVDPLERGLVTGDFNGDGRQDVAVLRPRGAQYMLNTGTGGLVSFGRFGGDPASGESFAPIDLNGDGKTDLAFAADDAITPRIFTLVAACPVACCASDGTCTVATAFCPTGTTRQSVASCSPNPCPQPQVACCDPCGVCTVVEASAGCPSGTTASMSSTCGPQTCPASSAQLSALTPTGFGRLEVFYAIEADAPDFSGPITALRSQSIATNASDQRSERFILARATPAPGWRFKEWASGTPCTPQNTTSGSFGIVTCTYERPCTETGTVSFQPIFELVPNVVRVTVTGPGTVTSTPAGILDCAPAGGTCQFDFPLSAAVRLTANPTPGNWFTGWTQSFASGTQPGTAVSRELVVNLPATATTVNVGAGFAGNNAPVALCRNIIIDGRSTCPSSFTITPQQVDNGSSDPDQAFGDSIQLSLDNSGPFPVGVSTVTLTVRDSLGLSTSCQATVTVLGQDCNADSIPDVCQCFFDNTPGLPPQRQADAQLAHVGGGTSGGARVADDFYLAAGQVHRVFGFRGKMFTSALPGLRKARLDFFEDCDGVPAATPFASFTNSSIEQEIDVGNGFSLVSYFFDLCDPAAGVFPPPAPGKPAEPLWLDGGKAYWVSLTGLPASSGGDDALSFWVATPTSSPLIGRSPHKAEGTLAGIAAYQNVAWGPWQNLSECCIGCVNMEFALLGESCDCAFENGFVDRSAVLGLPSGSVGSSEFRAVDNFVLPPCDPKDVCLIEGFVWTSCPTPTPIVEIYRDDCGVPSDLLIAGVANATATDLGVSRTLRGKTFKLWRLRASLPGITLPAGNHWLGLGASGTGSLNEETLFAASAPRCSDPGCTINGKPAVFRRTSPSSTPPAAWEPNGTDLAFRVVTRGAAFWRPDSGDALPGSPSPTLACRVDVDDNGAVGVGDIFAFLTAWFAGCP